MQFPVLETLNNNLHILKLFKSIVSMSQDGIYVCDKDGKTLVINDALIEITKIPEETFYSYTLPELVAKKILPNSCAYQTLLTKSKHNMIIDYYNGNKAILTSTPVFDNKKEIFCIVSNVRDITELKNLQDDLEKSNRKNMEYEELLLKLSLFKSLNIVFRDKKMFNLISLAKKFAKNDSPILLLGESGVGKDVIAQYIHQNSGRTGEFVRVNCGAIPNDLLESELFGFEKGAFTGANNSKIGLFELANKGTIFLDEIGDMPYALQVKLLNVLQEKQIRRLGATHSKEIDMRVIAATNLNLAQSVEKKEFRGDLFYRLNVLSLTIPPLRERKDDIITLTFHFLKKLEEKYSQKKQIEPEVLDHFIKYDWPGNIRELNNIVERMYHMSETNLINMTTLPEDIKEKNRVFLVDIHNNIQERNFPLKEAIQMFEKEYIIHAIENSETLKECAAKLNIGVSTLMRKKSNLGIK
ncbi:MAG TPA: sigma 54-interacting transcriptional regulator [Ureibacillus sp.]|nr:sigma 54-interacting transcriptional regulator [Ureibacillus sp.]